MTTVDHPSWRAAINRVSYPDFTLGQSWPYGIGISLFITAFVGIFLLPSDFTGLERWREASYYGLVTLVFYLLNSIVSNYLFTQRVQAGKWRVYHHILLTLWNFLTISLGNWALIWLAGGVDLSLSGFVQVVVLTLLVGSIPIVGATLLRQNIQLKRQLLESQTLERMPDSRPILASLVEINDGKNVHTFDLNKMLFVEANRNYIEVHQKDLPVQQIRLSMKGLGEQWVSLPTIIRCHRAFFVVLTQIQEVDGNAQGFQISLRDSERLIPVSRGYIPAFKAKYDALREA